MSTYFEFDNNEPKLYACFADLYSNGWPNGFLNRGKIFMLL